MPLEAPVPAVKRGKNLNRNLPASHAKEWLRRGWQDFKHDSMEASLLYGVFVTLVSILIVTALFVFHIDYVLFPALAAFLIFGPALAFGLYEKSRLLETQDRVGIVPMLKARARSQGQIAFIGLVMILLIALWVRSGVLLYAMFFGLREFPGFGKLLGILLTEGSGWLLILSGSVFGGLFAAAALALSTFAVPMLLQEETDAFSAMGSSMALAWNNVVVLLSWGAIVAGLFVISILTGFLGLIIIFPVLGHATWHAYRDIRGHSEEPIFGPAIEVDKSVG